MDIATRILMDAPVGVDVDLERTGSSLEIPQVYDAVARELTARGAAGGLAVLVSETDDADDGALISRFRFRRLR